jgi:hypothetical protein
MPKSKYFGVTHDARLDRHKVQIFINGKPRFFGYYESEIDAAQLAENARLHLQEFFPKPPPVERLFDVVAAEPVVENMRATLTAEGAPTYTHLPAGAESLPDEVERLAAEVTKAHAALSWAIRRLNLALQKRNA